MKAWIWTRETQAESLCRDTGTPLGCLSSRRQLEIGHRNSLGLPCVPSFRFGHHFFKLRLRDHSQPQRLGERQIRGDLNFFFFLQIGITLFCLLSLFCVLHCCLLIFNCIATYVLSKYLFSSSTGLVRLLQWGGLKVDMDTISMTHAIASLNKRW